MKKIFVIILVIAFLIIGSLIFLSKNKCYKNNNIGISFSYPRQWGDVIVVKGGQGFFRLPGGKMTENIKGDFEIYLLRFATNDYSLTYYKDFQNLEKFSLETNNFSKAIAKNDISGVFDGIGSSQIWHNQDNSVQRISYYAIGSTLSAPGYYSMGWSVSQIYPNAKKRIVLDFILSRSLYKSFDKVMSKHCDSSEKDSGKKCYDDLVEYAKGTPPEDLQKEINIVHKVLDSIKIY